MAEKKVITVALAGQPNVGKTSIFNALTGLNQHVGNWPGKTVEQKTGSYIYEGVQVTLVDLPGTYSLSANSPEEIIAREYIISAKPDVIVALLSAPVLERNLYLVAELLGLQVRLVIGLNMLDVAASEGVLIEPEVLQAALGAPVVSLVATKGKGIAELMRAINDMAAGRTPYAPKRPEIRADHQDVLARILALAGDHTPEEYPREWVALKLLEGDSEITRLVRQQVPANDWEQIADILRSHEDAVLAVAGGRYEWVARMVRAAVVRPRTGQITLTSRLDQVATHPFWGLLVLAGILGLIFGLTYTLGAPLQNALHSYLIHSSARFLEQSLSASPPWVKSLLIDGLLGGVGTVITFLPILVIFFAAMAVMEDVGYMARAAYVMDGFMHKMGLHGKSFLPLFLGFGCNVSAVVGSRVIESPTARLLTILVAPLVPCTGRMVVLTFIAPLFFGRSAAWISWGLVGVNLIVLAVLGIVLGHLLFRGEQVAFIMELPLYHVPNLRTIGLVVKERTLEFLQKAGTLILVFSVIIWALSMLPGGQIETSFLAAFGKWLAPLGAFMGMDWQMIVALLSSFVAKENSIATLGILFGAGGQEVSLGQMLQQALSPAAALAFLVVQMLFVPCAATVGAMYQESRSWKWTGLGVALLLLVSLLGGGVAYHVALLVGR